MLNKIKTQELNDLLFEKNRIKFYVLNLEKIHPAINGNKYFKLKYNLEEFFRSGKNKILTFGGAYSNHIYATASAGKEYNLETIGVIRGEELKSNSNHILRSASKMGMKFKFISREVYRKKEESAFLEGLKEEFGDFYLLPEGGSNELAVKGCREIAALIDTDFDWICCACGTGGTLAGISLGLNKNQKALGIPVLRVENYFDMQIKRLLKNDYFTENIILNNSFHFGGYAKTNEELRNFQSEFYTKFSTKIDPVYNTKLFYGVFKLIEAGYFVSGSRIVCVNTGGNYE